LKRAMKKGHRVAAGLAFALVSLLLPAQSDLSARSIQKRAAVEYLFPEQVTVAASKPVSVALHFSIAPGLHINSHTPKDGFLIPTAFTIPADSGVILEEASYPQGADVILPSDPKTKLNVYSGEFVIQARIVASPGEHLVEARLRYQACDQNACMPPKTITVPIDVIGK